MTLGCVMIEIAPSLVIARAYCDNPRTATGAFPFSEMGHYNYVFMQHLSTVLGTFSINQLYKRDVGINHRVNDDISDIFD
eukprot:CAMPEP_0198684510 /NCGR_PEP_ID=MMETSP1468-20131203/12319_1 /TAXON_ID=1461545 /ORGANISM="Mantoniella sp, Strain CCMP1436" /LENGTH=79 /DNA_ID=CAMNT_0044429375 /DNA_START=46 /DNA_END=282 /DNA_ORIENTATION=+